MFEIVVRKGIHLCVACASAFGLQAQTVTLLDQVTRTPIPDVTLTCVQTGAVVVTKTNGKADITPLKGCGSIRFDHISYTPLTMDWATLSTSTEVDLGYRVNMLHEVVTSDSRFTEAKQDVPEQINVLGRGVGELRKIVAFRKFAFICLVKRSQMWIPPPPEYTTSTGMWLPERWQQCSGTSATAPFPSCAGRCNTPSTCRGAAFHRPAKLQVSYG